MKRQLSQALQRGTSVVLGLMLTGCATYRPQPLPTAPDLTQTPQLTAPAQQFGVPGLPPHLIPADGLDETAVMTLAVFNSPDLKAVRLQAGIANAQLLEAGLLPDPRFGAGFATSALNYGGTLGLSQDIQALLTRGSAKASAAAGRKQVNLNILWQEIQVAERARELFLQARSEDELEEVMTASQRLLEDQYSRDHTAMERNDEIAGTVSADLMRVSDADTSLRQLQTEANLTRHQLNELLGLQPNVQLHLIGPTQLPSLDQRRFEAAVSALPRTRADLLALRAGYRSQEETLRRAILAQFPSLSAGVDLERDPIEGVNAFGPQVTLSLPIFNRNRGQIAIQHATRDLLRQQYQAQLDASVNQADQVRRAIQIMAAQLSDLQAQLPLLDKMATAAGHSFQQHNLNAALYVSAQSNLLTKQEEAIRLCASLEVAKSSLDTLLGLPFTAPGPKESEEALALPQRLKPR